MGTIKNYSSFILLPSLLSLLQVDAFLLTIVSPYIRLITDTNNFTKRLTRMYHHTATESPYCLHGAKASWTPTLAEMSNKFGFVYLFICLQCKVSGSTAFFWFFFYEVRHCKVRKWQIPVYEKKFMDSEGSKSSKNEVLGFYQKSYLLRYMFFCVIMKVSMVL